MGPWKRPGDIHTWPTLAHLPNGWVLMKTGWAGLQQDTAFPVASPSVSSQPGLMAVDVSAAKIAAINSGWFAGGLSAGWLACKRGDLSAFPQQALI